MPFRMWFYPIPSLIALAGWLFVLGTVRWQLWIGLAVVVFSGVIVYFLFVRKPVEEAGR
jgi:hypothetical protein